MKPKFYVLLALTLVVVSVVVLKYGATRPHVQAPDCNTHSSPGQAPMAGQSAGCSIPDLETNASQ